MKNNTMDEDMYFLTAKDRNVLDQMHAFFLKNSTIDGRRPEPPSSPRRPEVAIAHVVETITAATDETTPGYGKIYVRPLEAAGSLSVPDRVIGGEAKVSGEGELCYNISDIEYPAPAGAEPSAPILVARTTVGHWVVLNGGTGGSCCDCCEFVEGCDRTLSDGVLTRSKLTVDVSSSPMRLNTAGNAKIGILPFEYVMNYTASGPDGREGWMVSSAILQSMLFAVSAATGTPVPADRISAVVAKFYIVYKNEDEPLPYPSTTLHLQLDATVNLLGLEDPETPPPP